MMTTTMTLFVVIGILESSVQANVVNMGFISVQYYYAHAPKDFNMEGVQHYKGDGKIYGGDPVLLKTISQEEK